MIILLPLTKESETRKYISFKNIMKTTTDTDLFPSFFLPSFSIYKFHDWKSSSRLESFRGYSSAKTDQSEYTCLFRLLSLILPSCDLVKPDTQMTHVYNFSSCFSFTSSWQQTTTTLVISTLEPSDSSLGMKLRMDLMTEAGSLIRTATTKTGGIIRQILTLETEPSVWSINTIITLSQRMGYLWME